MQLKDKEIKEALKGWTRKIKQYQKPSTSKAIWQITNTFLPFIGLWVLMYLSLSWHIAITIALAPLNAFLMVRIFIIQHDCGHQSFTKSTAWNNVIGWFCSIFSSIPYKYWATNHNFHHVHSGQLEYRDIGDIDTLTVKEFRAKSSWNRFKYKLFRSAPVMFVLGPIYYLGVVNRLPFARVKGWKKTLTDLFIDNSMMILAYCLFTLWLGWKFVIIQAIIVALFGIIAVWFFYVQHQHEHAYKHWQKNWDYLLSAIRGSTYYNLPKFMHWLTGNIGFHHIHHLSSGIPNYNLPKCAKENPIFQRFVTTITFTESLRCIRHKLWDEEQQRMISFREFYRREKK